MTAERMLAAAQMTWTASFIRLFWMTAIPIEAGCWEWSGIRKRHPTHPYGYIWIPKEKRLKRAHRVAWEMLHGEIPKGLEVAHHCDNPPCVNPAHLFLATHLQNMQDMTRKERDRGHTHPEMTIRGEAAKNHRLTEQDIASIRASRNKDVSALAKTFDVSLSTIYKVWQRRRWTHLP
jgi:hypothetical protein